MSFWPRGSTLVEDKRRDLRLEMVESGEIEMGIDLPLNLTLTVMVASPWGSLAPAVTDVASISPLPMYVSSQQDDEPMEQILEMEVQLYPS